MEGCSSFSPSAIGTEILLLVTTISGLFFFLRWDKSTSAKMMPLVLPDGCSSIFLGLGPLSSFVRPSVGRRGATSHKVVG